MIKYDLKCSNDHSFDSWFSDSQGFEKLCKSGQVTCPICGDARIRKSLMAPGVPAKANTTDAAQEIAKLRADIEANSEDVGGKFAQVARAMHDGDEPQRQIHGEAKLDEAKSLIEDGVPVMPLPFVPKSRSN